MASEKEFFRLKGAEGVEGVVGTLFFLVVTPHQQPVLPYGRPTDRGRGINGDWGGRCPCMMYVHQRGERL